MRDTEIEKAKQDDDGGYAAEAIRYIAVRLLCQPDMESEECHAETEARGSGDRDDFRIQQQYEDDKIGVDRTGQRAEHLLGKVHAEVKAIGPQLDGRAEIVHHHAQRLEDGGALRHSHLLGEELGIYRTLEHGEIEEYEEQQGNGVVAKGCEEERRRIV